MKIKSSKTLWSRLSLLVLSLASLLLVQGCSVGKEILEANSELAEIVSDVMNDAEDLTSTILDQLESDAANSEEAPAASEEESSEEPEESSKPEEPIESAVSSEPESSEDSSEPVEPEPPEALIDIDGEYSEPEDVALYIYTYGELPKNFLTKNEARDLGWVSSEGNLWDVAYGMSIGGDRFGNREGLLPKKSGRTWYECDVNYYGGYRGSERILYSNDGLIFYTDDHYESFTQLY